ncbi:DUF2844 domain-containing protein [Paraburkholderia lacunae]|uniref:DUF2844 domain-containing protein n=1 Tax=Paraburkholderia lacunae TaxID=2211104 RepID=A0A370MY80_9BURK|nr:DUF2844 domain-containing protein [Paraburkholderia lacunae]RDJ98343.1 hypothetical protein DLM46_34100 [Paraburkholderia lacunae]
MPNPSFRPTVATPALLLVLLLGSADARAELGGTMPGQADPAAASSAPQTLLNGALRMRTLTDMGNTTVTEYASSTGQIVAYTWQGPTMPDLRSLLAKYADSYRAGAALTAGGNLHTSRVVRPDVIVESGGPMRGYVGRAWLPAALPAGVTPDDFR